jgi:hypothetical protein
MALGASPRLAGQEKVSAKPVLSTITSTDGVLQVRYPQFLIRCEHLDAENPDVWTPESGCVASIPVCDSSGHSGNVLSCLGYPLTEFQGSELQAAAFSVSRLDSFATAKECLGNWANKNTIGVHAGSIHGMTFQAAKAVETEASHVADHYIYRTFHKAACYELDVNIAVALDSAFAAEDAPRKLTHAEREKIKAELTRALDGFRFLK